MGQPRTWTDEQLREAVASSTTLKMVKQHLGLKGTGDAHYDLKARISQLTHFTRIGISTVPWSERELRAAMRGAANLSAMLDRLGVPQQSKYFRDVNCVAGQRSRRTAACRSSSTTSMATSSTTGSKIFESCVRTVTAFN
jgi:hypothetical protein